MASYEYSYMIQDALSTGLISGLISGMIVVIREEYTAKNELERCFRQLTLSNVKILGCVMNEAESGTGGIACFQPCGALIKPHQLIGVGQTESAISHRVHPDGGVLFDIRVIQQQFP